MRPALPALLVGATCIALSPIFVRVADVGPTASASWRVALAAPLLWPLMLAAPRAQAARPSAASVANSTLLANLASLFVTLALWLFWRQRPSGVFLLGLAAALGGVAMLVRASLAFSSTALLGDALGVVTAVFYAGYLLAVKDLRDRGARTLELMAITTTVTALFLLPVALPAKRYCRKARSAGSSGVLVGEPAFPAGDGGGVWQPPARRAARAAANAGRAWWCSPAFTSRGAARVRRSVPAVRHRPRRCGRSGRRVRPPA